MLKRFNPKLRHQARYFAVQAIYQWQLTQDEPLQIANEFMKDHQEKLFDHEYFTELLSGVAAHINELDTALIPYIDRRIEELDPVELSILRLGMYELIYRLEIPYRVVINEGVELAKIFGAADGYKYINGVLDQAQKQLRPLDPNHK